jgi:hypothetical protein
MVKGSTSAARASRPSSCSHRHARAVERPERASLHRRDPHAGCPGAGARSDPQLAALLDHHQQRVRIEQRQAPIGHQSQQPQL